MNDRFDDIFDEGRFDDAFREGLGDFEADPPAGAFDSIMRVIDAEKPKTRFFHRFKYAAAASMLLFSAAASSYYFLSEKNGKASKLSLAENRLPSPKKDISETGLGTTQNGLADTSPGNLGASGQKEVAEQKTFHKTSGKVVNAHSEKEGAGNKAGPDAVVQAKDLSAELKTPKVYGLSGLENKGLLALAIIEPLQTDLEARPVPINQPFFKTYIFAAASPLLSYQSIEAKSEYGGMSITDARNNSANQGASFRMGLGYHVSKKTAFEITGHLSSFSESVQLTGKSSAPDGIVVSADADKMTITPTFFTRSLDSQKQNTLAGLSLSLRHTLGQRGRVSHFAKISLGVSSLVYAKGNAVQSVSGTFPSSNSGAMLEDRVANNIGQISPQAKASAFGMVSYQIQTKLTSKSSFYVEPFVQSQMGSIYKRNSLYQLRFNNIGVNIGLSMAI